jgi:hypothetical protein
LANLLTLIKRPHTGNDNDIIRLRSTGIRAVDQVLCPIPKVFLVSIEIIILNEIRHFFRLYKVRPVFQLVSRNKKQKTRKKETKSVTKSKHNQGKKRGPFVTKKYLEKRAANAKTCISPSLTPTPGEGKCFSTLYFAFATCPMPFFKFLIVWYY